MCRKRNVNAPQTFLGRYPLRTGALVMGILMCLIMVICVIASIIQVFEFQKCKECPNSTLRNVFALCITAALYCVFMLVLSIWFLWGVKKAKASVVIAYLVAVLLWWVEAACLLTVLICLYSDYSFVLWLVCMLFAILAMVILLYGIFIIYGYWVELKSFRRNLQP